MDGDEAELYGAAFTDQLLSQMLGDVVMPGLQQMQKAVSDIAMSSAPKPDPNIVTQVEGQKAIEAAKIASQEKKQTEQAELKKLLELNNNQQEEANRASQERLAQLATTVEMVRDQQNNGAKQMLTEFQAAHETQLAVLNQVLTAALTQMSTAASEGAAGAVAEQAPSGDLAQQILEPLLGSLQTTLSDSIGGLSAPNSPMAQAIMGLAKQQSNFEMILEQQRKTMEQAFGSINQSLQGLSSQQQYDVELSTDPVTGVKRARRVPSQTRS
jgi:hypothetical protein